MTHADELRTELERQIEFRRLPPALMKLIEAYAEARGKHPRISLHLNTDATGDRHVIIFTGEAVIDRVSPPANEVPAYLYKYRTGITDLNMTPESFSAAYSIAIRITPTELRGWE